MEIKSLKAIEQFVHLTLESYEGQIRIIHSLGNHPYRGQHIEDLRRMIVFLQKLVESKKEHLINDIDGYYSRTADEITERIEFFAKSAKEIDNREFKAGIKKLKEQQPELIHEIGQQEVETEQDTIRRFRVITDRIQIILNTVDHLQR